MQICLFSESSCLNIPLPSFYEEPVPLPKTWLETISDIGAQFFTFAQEWKSQLYDLPSTLWSKVSIFPLYKQATQEVPKLISHIAQVTLGIKITKDHFSFLDITGDLCIPRSSADHLYKFYQNTSVLSLERVSTLAQTFIEDPKAGMTLFAEDMTKLYEDPSLRGALQGLITTGVRVYLEHKVIELLGDYANAPTLQGYLERVSTRKSCINPLVDFQESMIEKSFRYLSS